MENLSPAGLETLQSLTPENLAFIAAYFGLKVAVGLFATRTVLVFWTRQFGLYHPDYYGLWPRVPWRLPYKGYEAVKKWYEQTFAMGKRSTGGFAGMLSTFALLYRPGMILLGRAYGLGFGLLQPVGSTISRHLFYTAMTGSGKTTMLASMLSCWRGSAFVIDVNGDITDILGEHDSRTFLSFDLVPNSGRKSVSINVFDIVKEARKREGEGAEVRWAARIAEALITTPSGARSPYFYDVGRQFLTGLILHVLTKYPEDCHHLPFVRDLIIHGQRITDDNGKELTKGKDAQTLLLRLMSRNQAFGGVVAGAAAAMVSASGETVGNARSTLQEQTQFLDYPDVRARIKHSSIKISELKTRDDIVLTFNASLHSFREEISNLKRLITNIIVYTFEAVKEKKGDCLFVIDELPSQKYNPALEVVLAAGRSTSLLFCGLAQNLEQMQQHYPHCWKSFVGEADVTYWMGGNHPDNNAYLSQALGQKTIIEKDPVSGRKEYRQVSTMEPEQVARFLDPDSNNLIVTRAGKRALKLKYDPYFTALPVSAYAADPEHGDTFLRSLTRRWFGRAKKPNASRKTSKAQAT